MAMVDRRVYPGWYGLDGVSLLSLVAFLASMPFLLAPLGLIRSVLPADVAASLLAPVAGAPFLTAMALAAMFASLAMLFVCLLKTAFARLGRRLLLASGALYVLGTLFACIVGRFASVDSLTLMVAGVFIGGGGAVLCMAWARQVQLPDLRTALASLVVLGAAVFAIDAALLPIGADIRAVILTALATIGTIGCLRGALAQSRSEGGATTSGANWWDVFGRLDMSLVGVDSEFASPLSRTLFFIVAPIVVFLLSIANMNIHHTAYGGFPIEIVGGAIAVVLSLLLLAVKNEQTVISFACRFYLPVIAVIVFVVGDFAPTDMRGLLLNVGVYAFCFTYGLVMCAMVITMIGRMKSLALPAACMLVIAACLIALLSYANIDAGALEPFKLTAVLILLLVSAVLLVAMPSSRIWDLVLGGVGAASVEEHATTTGGTATLEERCDKVAQAYALTPREAEILRFLGRGYGSVYIAETLVIAESTVRSHVKSIYRKIDVSSREELICRIDDFGETPEKPPNEV